MTHILSVGFDLPDECGVEVLAHNSRRSLQDADLVIFQPGLPQFSAFKSFQGKPSLDESDTAEVLEAREHWRRELDLYLKSNRTIILFCVPPQVAYVDSGNRQYSGTGRNRVTTTLVDLLSSYDSLPFCLPDNFAAEGGEVIPGRGFASVSRWWTEFGRCTWYSCYFAKALGTDLLLTKGKTGVVGWAASHTSGGTMVCLPPPVMEAWIEDHLKDEGGKERKAARVKLCIAFARTLITELLALASSFSGGVPEVPPEWSSSDLFDTAGEAGLKKKLGIARKEAAEGNARVKAVHAELSNAGKLRPLLWAKSSQLEVAVLHALRVLGFDAKPLRDGASEFDAVFSSPEGRYIGECEGKDRTAVNVDKFRQLESNITEDLQREGVSLPAKGVLFGNGWRLSPPAERQSGFTQKCILSAKQKNIALVHTYQLYEVCKSLADMPDAEFSRACRKAILDSAGVVTFPSRLTPAQTSGSSPQA